MVWDIPLGQFGSVLLAAGRAAWEAGHEKLDSPGVGHERNRKISLIHFSLLADTAFIKEQGIWADKLSSFLAV